MAKKKSAKKRSTAATTIAAAAAAAVAAAQDETASVDIEDLDDDEDTEEILEGLEDIEDFDSVVQWELACRSPYDRAGLLRYLTTEELRTLKPQLIEMGPGTYTVRAKDSRGKYVKKGYRKITISSIAARTAGGATVAQSSAPDPMAVMRQLETQYERQRQARKQEWRDEMKFWSPLLIAIAPKLVEALFGRGESVKDLVTALASMKQLQGDQAPVLDQIRSVLELTKELGGNERGSTWPDIVKDGLTQLAPAVSTLVTRAAGPQSAQNSNHGANGGQQPILPAPPGTSPAAALSAQHPTNGIDPMWEMAQPILRKLAAELQEFAENGAEPDIAAEALLAKTPRAVRALIEPKQLKEWLETPDWFDRTVAFWPTLQPYNAYCDDVRQELLAIVEGWMNPQQEDSPVESRQGA